ncbi:MAG TPA: insulinase family protein [Nitrospirae bacterium]|nr:insulinase family protein [Nitrospirota bacterium]
MYDSRFTIHNSRQLVRIFILLCAVYCSLFTSAYALDAKRQVLENGLTLLMVERHNLPIVKVTVGIRAGSLMEPEDRAGLAGLTAALLTEGTKKRSAAQISEESEFVGASVGASGGDDFITVSLSVLKKDVSLGFDLLSDIILNPVFPEKELNKKVKQIKGSLKAREDDPGFVASKIFKSEVFGKHPYGRLTAGSPETLDRIKRDDVVKFHSALYVPNNSIMSVVGDITPEEVSGLLERYFSAWRAKPVELSPPEKPAEIKKKKTVVIDRDLTQANIILGHIGISRDNPEYYAVSVMNYILGGGGFGSRLMQNIREEKGLVYDIHSSFSANKYGGSFRVSLQTKNESANVAIEEVLNEMKKIMNGKVSDSELSDAKAFLTGSFPMRIETSGRIAGFLVAVEYYGLGVDYVNNYPGYINSVTKEDVLEAAKKYLDPEQFILVVVADKDKASIVENKSRE